MNKEQIKNQKVEENQNNGEMVVKKEKIGFVQKTKNFFSGVIHHPITKVVGAVTGVLGSAAAGYAIKGMIDKKNTNVQYIYINQKEEPIETEFVEETEVKEEVDGI